MGLWDILMENFSNSPEWKGKRFEKFVIEKFNRKYFDIVEMTHSWKTNQERYVESSLNPDFILRYNPTNEVFAVECKYRSKLNPEGMLDCCKPQQLERYRKFAKERNIPVFLVIGFKGIDDAPDDMFVIPLEELKYPTLYPSVYRNYSKNPKTNFFWKNGKLS
jgi:hypothetical protein